MTVEKSKGSNHKMPPATKKVAPDGGWAWMVCLGVSLVNVSKIHKELLSSCEQPLAKPIAYYTLAEQNAVKRPAHVTDQNQFTRMVRAYTH